jgi:hypothetical protein
MGSPLLEKEGFAPLQYMTCIGLALKEILVGETGAVAYSVVNFNALPDVYQVRKRPLAEILWLPTIMVGVVLAGMGIWGIVSLRNENRGLMADANEINQRVQQQSVRAQDVNALEEQAKAVETPLGELRAQLDSLAQSRDLIAGQLGVVEDAALTSGVTLAGVTTNAKQVTANGSANGETEMFLFARTLEESGLFSTVTLTSINATEGGVSFAVNLS